MYNKEETKIELKVLSIHNLRMNYQLPFILLICTSIINKRLYQSTDVFTVYIRNAQHQKG